MQISISERLSATPFAWDPYSRTPETSRLINSKSFFSEAIKVSVPISAAFIRFFHTSLFLSGKTRQTAPTFLILSAPASSSDFIILQAVAYGTPEIFERLRIEHPLSEFAEILVRKLFML